MTGEDFGDERGLDHIPVARLALAKEVVRVAQITFPGPYSLEQFIKLRKECIQQSTRLNRGMTTPLSHRIDSEKYLFPGLVLGYTGLLTSEEELFIERKEEKDTDQPLPDSCLSEKITNTLLK